MPPALHAAYSPAEAVAAFGPGAAEWFCDGQFAVLPAAVLGFFTAREFGPGATVHTPSAVEWRPGRQDEAPGDDFPWLPAPVREVWAADRSRKVREHHLFLRCPGEDRYAYAGPAHLGAYGFAAGQTSASFTLNEKLPRDLWLMLGGYPGWLVAVNHQGHRVDAGDAARLDGLLAGLSARRSGHVSLTRYEGDELSLHTNRTRGWLMYLRHPADSGLYTRDTTYAGDPAAEQVFRCGCGIDLEYTTDRTLPRDQAVEVVRAFFAAGRLPDSVPWTDEW